MNGELDYEQLFKLESYLADGSVPDADLLKIDSSCAIIIFPTDEQFEQMKKDEGEDNFETIVDDGNFYQATAMGLLDSLKIKTVTADKKYIQFNGSQSWTLDIRKKNLPEWNLIFFNRAKEPIIVSAPMLDAAKIQEYFQSAK